MSSHIDDLIGKAFQASIGEPWDFESEAGPNYLEGIILDIIVDSSGNQLIICEVTPFTSLGKKIFSVVAVNRYKGKQNELIDAITSGTATVNFMFQVSGDDFQPENLESILRNEDDCSFLVGTMKLREKR